MQLSLAPPLYVKATSVKLKSTLFASLTGVTAIGTCSTVIFNSSNTTKSLANSFEPLKQVFLSSFLYEGIKQIGDTLHNWGTSIVGSKDAFKDMGEEAMKEILERIMEEPKDAKEIIEDLLKEQKEMADKAKEDQEKNKEPKEPQLEQERIKEEFKKSKGSPQSKEEVFGYLVGDTLQSLMKSPYSSFDSSLASTEESAKKVMKEYIQKVKEASNKNTKVGKANKEFIDALGDKEDELIKELANIASLAIGTGHRDFKQLAQAFEKIMKDKFTVEVDPSKGGDEEGINLDNIVKQKTRK